MPSPDHYWPLLYVMGARREEDDAEIFGEGVEQASISMLSVLLTPKSLSLADVQR